MEEKSQENLDNPTVFKTSHEEISRTAQTQCEMGKHKFQKHSENEIYCPVCQSCYIINPDYMDEFIK